MNSPQRIAFIGAGNMARSLLGGLLAATPGRFRLAAADPDPAQRKQIEALGIETCADNAPAIAGADLVVLAVKPQVASQALSTVSETLQREHPTLLSIAAGLRIADIEAAAGCELAVVRAMPNTPALVQRGISGWFANERVDDAGRALTRAVLEAAGTAIEVSDENLLDAVTAVSGSGPAYFFLLVEALAAAGVKAGLPAATAAELARATGTGAMALLDGSPLEPAELRKQVTSPGGTTAAALEILQSGLPELLEKAVLNARKRAQELARA
ncbi:MAG: pyrroline-5-carboxylate reductase [Gammaproteobacteria bacterium]